MSEIDTDVDGRICSFQLTDANLDIKAKLDELAATNEHIKGWSMAN